MDTNQICFFKARYANMTEDEPAVLVATRRDALSEEAAVALSEVLRSRNLPAFISEVNEVVGDLNAQASAARLEIERQRQHNRRARKGCCFLGCSWWH